MKAASECNVMPALRTLPLKMQASRNWRFADASASASASATDHEMTRELPDGIDELNFLPHLREQITDHQHQRGDNTSN